MIIIEAESEFVVYELQDENENELSDEVLVGVFVVYEPKRPEIPIVETVVTEN